MTNPYRPIISYSKDGDKFETKVMSRNRKNLKEKRGQFTYGHGASKKFRLDKDFQKRTNLSDDEEIDHFEKSYEDMLKEKYKRRSSRT